MAVTTVATAVTATLGVTAAAAFWPVTLIVAGVAALAAGIAYFVKYANEANAEFNSLTAVSKQHRIEIDELNAEYTETAALYGENSEQARRLAEDIAGLESVYEATKMTLTSFMTAFISYHP